MQPVHNHSNYLTTFFSTGIEVFLKGRVIIELIYVVLCAFNTNIYPICIQIQTSFFWKSITGTELHGHTGHCMFIKSKHISTEIVPASHSSGQGHPPPCRVLQFLMWCHCPDTPCCDLPPRKTPLPKCTNQHSLGWLTALQRQLCATSHMRHLVPYDHTIYVRHSTHMPCKQHWAPLRSERK